MPRTNSYLHSIVPHPSNASFFTARTCVRTLPHWEPMWQHLVKITIIQVDITSIIPKLVDGVPSHAKET
jgi:hypothetical protein